MCALIALKSVLPVADDEVMEIRVRRALLRLLGAAIVVLGVFVTSTAVRRADQVVASGRDVLLGGELVDLFTAGDLEIGGHAQLAGTAVALGDLDVDGSLRVERDAARIFAVGGAVTVQAQASVVFPEAGTLKYGTIRTGALGSAETVVRDPGAVSRFADMVPALAASAVCFGRTASTGFATVGEGGVTLLGDGASGLQVFTVDGALTGPVTVSRVPRDASILINVVGSSVEIAPTGAGWREIAPSTLVNVPDADEVQVGTSGDLRLNALVGNAGGRVTLGGERLEGGLLSLASVEVRDTRITHGPLLAPMLPKCDAHQFGEPEPEPQAPPVAAPSVAQRPSSSASTTSTTTTTTVPAGSSARGSRAVPGAAFALGGAASTGRWWVGIPISLVGSALLGWSWLDRHLRRQHAELKRRRALVRVLRRGTPPAES